MKKYFLFVFAFTLLALSTSTFAQNIDTTLLNSGGFEIKSNGYIEGDQIKTLAKNSTLNIVFQDERIGDIEPGVTIEVLKNDGTPVLSLKSPEQKMSGNSLDLTKYLEKNKEYFDRVAIDMKQVRVSLPLKYEKGEYKLNIKLDINGENKSIEYPFNVSNSPFIFGEANLTLEGSSVLEKVDYSSFLEKEDINKVSFRIVQNNIEIFKKEFDKTFYYRGDILIDEEVSELSKIKGTVQVILEVKDKDGQIIFSQTKNAKPNKGISYWYFVIVLLVLIVLIFLTIRYIKLRKLKVATLVVVLLCGTFAVALPQTIKAQLCGTKPADVCFEDKIVTSVCVLTSSCANQDVKYRLFFSTGKSQNIQSPAVHVGPVSVSVNICSQIGSTLNSGNKFYVASDSTGSSWERKRFHIFSFVKGTGATVTFDPGGRKRNVNYAVYDGGCNVTVYGRYTGAASNSKVAKTKIAEVGADTNTLCKSSIVNNDSFEANGDLLSRTTCGGSEISTVYIKGGVSVLPAQYSSSNSWTSKTVNVCSYMGYTAGTIPTGQSFYALAEQTSVWWRIKYPIFQFTFGTADTLDYPSVTDNRAYVYNAYKENIPTMTYDGSCNVTFKLVYRGAGTSSWLSGYKLVELGLVSNALCREPILVSSTSYEGDYRGPTTAQIESKTKIAGGKYDLIAPFFKGLSDCVSSSQCVNTGTWVDLYTDTMCTEKLDGVCGTSYANDGINAEACIIGEPKDYSNGGWSCEGINGGKKTSCSSFVLSCGAEPVATNKDVTFKVASSNASGVVSYNWADFPGVNGDEAVKIGGYDAVGFYSTNVSATDASGKQASTACYVSVGKCTTPKPDDIECPNDSGISTTYTCVDDEWVPETGSCWGGIDMAPVGAPCVRDGVTVNHRSSYKFFKSRVASICNGKYLICNDSNWVSNEIVAPDSVDNYKYRSCVEPAYNEF